VLERAPRTAIDRLAISTLLIAFVSFIPAIHAQLTPSYSKASRSGDNAKAADSFTSGTAQLVWTSEDVLLPTNLGTPREYESGLSIVTVDGVISRSGGSGA